MPHAKQETFQALAQYMDLLLDAICVVNPKGEFVYVSAGGERVFGYPPEEMIGRSIFEFIHPDDHERTRLATADIMSGVGKIDFENRYLRKNGDVATLLWSARYSHDDDLRIAVARDITEQRRIEHERQQLLEQLERLALYDPLTELPNRSYFYQRASQALEHRSDIAIVYIDLNHFKEINDQHGHAIGDQILHAAAQRLSASVRSHDTAARIGGDEFVVLLERIQHHTDVEAIVHKIQHALSEPIQIAALPHVRFDLAASFGIALSKEHGTNLEKLLLHADNAMYKAKRNA